MSGMTRTPTARRPDVFAIGTQNARFFGIGQVGSDHVGHDLAAERRVLDSKHDLDTLVEIALHPVRAAEEDFRLAPVAERKDATVLEKPADDAAHVYFATDAANTGT